MDYQGLMENKKGHPKEGKDADEEDDEFFPFVHLPSELLLNTILAWLPLRSLFRFKTVCKLWNSTISSPSKFTHFPSHLKKQSENPWLIFFTPKNFDFILAFDFEADVWFRFDSDFLSSSHSGLIWCIGSARGRLLIKFDSTLHVCNPITKSLFALPPFRRIKLLVTQGFYADFTPICKNGKISCAHTRKCGSKRMKGHEKEKADENPCASMKKSKTPDEKPFTCIRRSGFKVLVIGNNKSELVIEAYDAKKHSWILVGNLPSSFVIKHDEMVECNGLFYSLLLTPKAMLIIGGGFTEEEEEEEEEEEHEKEGKVIHWRIQALPDTDNITNPRLLSCRNALFMVCYNSSQDHECILMWRFESCSEVWIKMDPMPDVVSEDMKAISLSNWFDCVGVGKFICFRALSTQKVLTYNVCDGTWRWLPDLPYSFDTILIRGFQFEPRLEYGLMT